jgi:hypothetical protein
MLGLLCVCALAALPVCATSAEPDASVAQQPTPQAAASPASVPAAPATTAPPAQPPLGPASPAPAASAAQAQPGALRPEAYAAFNIVPVEAVDNYLAHGLQAYASPTLTLGVTIPSIRLALAGEFQVETFNHATANVPANGGGSIFLAAATKHTYTQDGRVDFRLTDSGIYLGLGGIYRASSYGYPELTAFGFGIEALPNLSAANSIYGRAFFYPNVNNEDVGIRSIRLSKSRWEIGDAHRLGHGNGYFTFAIEASNYSDLSENPRNVPSGNDIRIGPSVGFLIKF